MEINTSPYEQEVDTWWNQLSISYKERAFYAVIKRVYQGELVDKGSYRYILYNIFGFDPSYYALGMDCGFMSLHNSIMSDATFEEVNTKVCTNKVNGVCQLHNLHCSYPKCESTI